MTATTGTQLRQFLQKATATLSISDEDLLLRGITTEATERIFSLKRAALRLQAKYGSLEALEQRIKLEGVSPDDHTLYTDLLEWRAIRQELAELVSLLEMV